MAAQSDLLALEEAALSEWPALQTTEVDGWVLRFSGGCTKRANSVNALRPSGPFSIVREAAEVLYKERNLPAIFRISPLAPEEADGELEAAGYSLFDPSLVMTMTLTNPSSVAAVGIEHSPSGDWLNAVAQANGIAENLQPAHAAIVRLIATPAGFATIMEDGRSIGFDLAVCARDMVGLFDIVVVPDKRGSGFGRAITRALLDWGRKAGAGKIFLQVRCANTAALALYASLGFTEAYRYHYRVPPDLIT